MDDKNLFGAFYAEAGAERESAPTGGVSTMDLLVSLFLILLAFFVVLNSISNQKMNKTQAVVGSVSTKFDKNTGEKSGLSKLITQSALDSPSDQFYAELRSSVETMTDFVDNYPTRDDGLLRLELAPDILFVRGQSRLRFDQSPFLDNLAAVLNRTSSGEQRTLEILVRGGNGPVGNDWRGSSLYVQRAAELAAELEKRGVKSGLIITGVSSARDESIQMTFFMRKLNAALLSPSNRPELRGEPE